MNTTTDIIAISETKITNTVNVDASISLPNYTFVNCPSLTSAGGVGLFIHNTIEFKLRNDLTCQNNNLFESIWIEVEQTSLSSQKCIIEVIYRNPEPEISSFMDFIEHTMMRLQNSGNNYYIYGDFNINVLNHDKKEAYLTLLILCIVMVLKC